MHDPDPTRTSTSARLPLAGVALGALLAAAAVVLGIWFAGSALVAELLDPGAVVRWGLPVVTVATQLTAATALGALALVAFVLPRGGGRSTSDGRAAASAPVVAAGAAGAWTVVSVMHLVLTYSSIAGTPLTSPEFGPQLGMFVTAVPLGQTLLAVVGLAAVTCVAAMLVTGPRSAFVIALLIVGALGMQANTGHTAGAANHELAVSAMFLHLLGAAVWVGGLAALALVHRRLGTDLHVTVARYSTIAAWCFVGVAISGVVSGGIRIGSLDDLTSAYGVLLVIKVVLLTGLGAVGWAHRRLVVRRLSGQSDGGARAASWLFWRLVVVELALMGLVSGVATALASTAPPVPQEPPTQPTAAEIVTGHPLPPEPTLELWLTTFRWDLIPALGCLAAVVVYTRWVLRLRARGDAWPVGRTVCLVLGMLVLAWTTSGGAAVYGHVLFSAHMIQHMTMVMIVPILVVLSAPVTLAARALPPRKDGSRGPREWLLGTVHSRWAGFFAHPVVAAVNFAGSMIVFYYTDLFRLALTTYIGHLAMIAHFTLAGYLFVNALIGIDPGPRRPPYPVRLVLLFATMAFHAFFGVALVSDETLLVPEWFGLMGREWGPSALEDQRTGGAIAWGISEVPMLIIAITLAFSWTRDDERLARRSDRAAERDGDAELEAYNAMLARMAEREGTGRSTGAGR
ncbi:cytochrome c oxidase assembly protein [Cellulomonas bogoriensis]|uniref:cytochrome c oxidase assembly protein n=1 Tax=Cellulomonas bogoriensis TaxID=301388 RepID=UPI001E382816|nr:cytochrome c oxidase assembly protein [Cellulomonas bogoriensis]